MSKSRILSFFGIVFFVAVLIGATNKLTIDQQRLNATISGTSLVGMVPIGGMVAVNPTMQASDAWQPPATGVIKDGFMRADGHVITAQNVTDGSMLRAGTTLPSMIQKYPRGNTTSGTTSGSNTQASNVTVGNHATLGMSNHTALALSNHTALSLNAHSITQPAFNVPAHYHNSFSLTAAGQSGGSHSHTFSGYTGQCITVGTGCNHTKMQDDGGTVSRLSSDAHTHNSSSVSGSVGNQGGSNGDAAFTATRATDVALTNNHSFSQNIDAHSFSQNITAHSFSQNIDAHNVTNNAVNNEPAYVEVVWVIRVK